MHKIQVNKYALEFTHVRYYEPHYTIIHADSFRIYCTQVDNLQINHSQPVLFKSHARQSYDVKTSYKCYHDTWRNCAGLQQLKGEKSTTITDKRLLRTEIKK